MRCILQTVVFFVFPVVMPPRQSFPSHPRVRDAAALGFTSSLGPFAANGIMPGFHAMAEDYGVSFVAVQQSLTIYLFTYAFFSLVAGSFSDSYGRRPTFIGGMLLFAAASVGAAFSHYGHYTAGGFCKASVRLSVKSSRKRSYATTGADRKRPTSTE